MEIDERKLFLQKHRIDRQTRCMRTPLFVHIVLTERCPLNCSQCYSNISARELKWSDFCRRVDEIAEFGIPVVLLTGGDPVQYTKFLDAVTYITTKGLKCIISTSGVGLTGNLVHDLSVANIEKLFVSLNGSSYKINSLSRDGFMEAIGALQVLSQTNHKFLIGINWVARSDNVLDFPSMMELSLAYNLDEFVVLKNKKQRDGFIDSALSYDQTAYLAQQIMLYNQKMGNIISIDPCYKELRQLTQVGNSIFDNCSSGRTFLDIMPDNSLLPCRHLSVNNCSSKVCDSSYCSIRDYWKSIDRASFSAFNCYM